MRLAIVEDDVRLARSYQRQLERAGYAVEVFHDAESAWNFVRREWRNLQVVILDVLLPGQSGIELCRELRRVGVETPMLLLTALDQTGDKVLGLDAGADDYLTKPFPFAELLARLRALIRRPRWNERQSETEIRVGDLLIDQLQHAVYLGDRSVTLTPREYALVEYLAHNAGRVLTRQQINARVWPEGTDAGSNVLDAHMSHLREKLNDDGAAPLIQTVRGVGYTLRAADRQEPEQQSEQQGVPQ